MTYTLQKALAVNIESAFKIILETKHLYQSVQIDSGNSELLVADYVKKTFQGSTTPPHADIKAVIGVSANSAYKVSWNPENPNVRRPIFAKPNDEHKLTWISFKVPSVKVVCAACGERQPFNLVKATELIQDVWEIQEIVEKDPTQQTFVFVYQCQGCKGLPETFLIKRSEDKITLAGRSPIEKVGIPSYFPKAQSKYYSGALIAHNSGQTLAGIFLLRTLIEQFVRADVGGVETYADQILDKYAEKLPTEFKQRFPSLKDIYSRLSDAIHNADASDKIFDNGITDINKHFDARRVFDIS